jgi:hypothetical protein
MGVNLRLREIVDNRSLAHKIARLVAGERYRLPHTN